MTRSSDKQALATLTPEQLATAWCYLNVYEWPPTLPSPEPGSKRSSALMRAIERMVGIDSCLAMWNALEFYKASSRHA